MAGTIAGFYQHESCSLHDTGWRHPEHQGRLRAIRDGIRAALPELHGLVEARSADPAERGLLETVHAPAHLERVRAAVREAGRRGEPVHLTPDTVVSGASWDAARAAVGCAVAAVEAVAAGSLRAAFCAVRPPGHHATRDRAMGFCLLNGVAIAARRAIRGGAAERVLVVDWDVHHGNGTQEIFYEEPDVFYLSMHQSPHFPGTGAREERGAGAGEGTTLNVPLPPGLPPERYARELRDGVDRALEGFAPDLALVSCGFDAARGDPLGGFTLEPEHYRALTAWLVARLRGSASGRVVSVLEGGYRTELLGELAVAHLRGFLDAWTQEEGTS